jgi:hypothetical protein
MGNDIDISKEFKTDLEKVFICLNLLAMFLMIILYFFSVRVHGDIGHLFLETA